VSTNTRETAHAAIARAREFGGGPTQDLAVSLAELVYALLIETIDANERFQAHAAFTQRQAEQRPSPSLLRRFRKD
jgi:hypothetical protein